MDKRLIEQNPWWEGKDAIDRDKDLIAYDNARVALPLPEFELGRGIHVLRGPRQVGKTTLLKTLVKARLKTASPETVFYFSAESGYAVEDALREFIDLAGNAPKMILIDEATEDRAWATKIKYLVDVGKITGQDTVVITGSSSVDLKLGAERLPGRFVEGKEYLFYPYSFRDVAGFTAGKAGLLDFDPLLAKKAHLKEGLRAKFVGYAKNGGLPAVWNVDRELARERYARWAEGLISKNGRSIVYSKELLSKLGEKTTFDFLGLAKETSIKSHHTVESYVSFFEAGMFGKLIYNYSLAINAPDPKKEKKFVFLDPFLVEVFSLDRLESLIIEDIVGSHLLRVSDDLYFYRDKSGEIDFICKIGDRLIPVEVKWQNQVNESDTVHLKKFGSGFIISKDTFAVFGKISVVPAHVFLALIGKTLVKRKVL